MRDALRDRWLLWLLAAGLLARVVMAVLADPIALFLRADNTFYAHSAEALRSTGHLETGIFIRPPLYIIILAAIQSLSTHWTIVARLLQSLLGTLAAIPVYLTARRIADVRSARFAAGFLLFDPTLIAYAHMLWPETIFLLLVSIVFDGVGKLRAGEGRRAAVLGGVTGLAMLLKPAFGLFTLLLAGWMPKQVGPRAAVRLILFFGVAAALVISPWVIRNQLRYGPAIILENQGPYNLWIGNDPRAPYVVLQEWKLAEDPVSRSRAGLKRGLSAIRDDPGRFLRRFAERMVNFWGMEFFVVRNLIFGNYGDITKTELLLFFWIIQLGYAILLISAARGFRVATRDPTVRLIFMFALVFTVIISTMVSTSRFRVPFSFLLSVTAGIGVCRFIEGRIRRRGLLAAAFALMLLGLSAARPPFREIILGRFDKVTELRNRDWYHFRY